LTDQKYFSDAPRNKCVENGLTDFICYDVTQEYQLSEEKCVLHHRLPFMTKQGPQFGGGSLQTPQEVTE